MNAIAAFAWDADVLVIEHRADLGYRVVVRREGVDIPGTSSWRDTERKARNLVKRLLSNGQ